MGKTIYKQCGLKQAATPTIHNIFLYFATQTRAPRQAIRGKQSPDSKHKVQVTTVALQFTTPNKKQEIWSRLDFLFDNGFVLHYVQYNGSRFFFFFPVYLSLAFFVLLVYVVGVLYCFVAG